MPQNSRLGLEGRLYWNAGTHAAPDWQHLSNAREVKTTLKMAEADVSTRGSAGWREKRAALADLTLDWKMVWKPADAGFQAVRTAFLNRSNIELLVLDGDKAVAGNQGPRFAANIFQFDREEDLEQGMMATCQAFPTPDDFPPEWYTVP